MEEEEYLYRVEDRLFATAGTADDTPYGVSDARTALHAFRIVRRTPCGAWILVGGSDKRFVNLQRRRRYAAPTVDEAIESFRARKARQLSILRAQIRNVENALTYLDGKGFYWDDRKYLKGETPWQ